MSEESSNSGSGDTSSMHQYQHQSSCGNISMGTSSYKSYEDDGFSVTRIVDATAESACHLGATSSADLASAACDMQQLELSCETSSIEPLSDTPVKRVFSESGQKIVLSLRDDFGETRPGHNIMDFQMCGGKAKTPKFESTAMINPEMDF